MDELPITVKTPAADKLTDLQEARRAVQHAITNHVAFHTRETKLALKAAQAREQKLTKAYADWRMARLQVITDQMRKDAR